MPEGSKDLSPQTPRTYDERGIRAVSKKVLRVFTGDPVAQAAARDRKAKWEAADRTADPHKFEKIDYIKEKIKR